MKGPGREWYEKNDEGAIYKSHEAFEGELGWNHKQFLNENISAKTLLDIGCGRGTFLNEARKRGYLVAGIDFDRLNVELAKTRFGLNEVKAETLEVFVQKNPRKRFDVITFFEVLEHLPDPREFLRTVRSLLNPGGYIALSVPNRNRYIDTIAYLDHPPYHLTRWTGKALQCVLMLEGFESLRLGVKPLQTEDLIDVLRFGIGRRLIRAAQVGNRQRLLASAASLYQFKRKVIGMITIPMAWLLRFTGCQGTGLYCLARIINKDEKGNVTSVSDALRATSLS
jgi:SAM-dependent methyltransferase